MRLLTSACLASVLAMSAIAPAQNKGNWFWKDVTGNFSWLYIVGGGLALPLMRDGEHGQARSLRTLDALAVGFGIVEAGKALTRVPRPDVETNTSFPSGHSSHAFVVATMQSEFHPKEAPFWYGIATLISWSRIGVNRHRLADVVVGSALGYAVAKWELSEPRGILLRPFISDAGKLGVTYSSRF